MFVEGGGGSEVETKEVLNCKADLAKPGPNPWGTLKPMWPVSIVPQ